MPLKLFSCHSCVVVVVCCFSPDAFIQHSFNTAAKDKAAAEAARLRAKAPRDNEARARAAVEDPINADLRERTPESRRRQAAGVQRSRSRHSQLSAGSVLALSL